MLPVFQTQNYHRIYINAVVAPMRVVKSVPEEQHADQDEGGGNRIPDKVHPMDALTATKPGVFILDIKTIPALSHLTNQPWHLLYQSLLYQ